jgi:two-component system cell cycle sensor histidine kinase/response regulator CckA
MPHASLPTDALLEALPDAVLVVDAKGSVALANRQAEAVFGRPREELTGLPVAELLPHGLDAGEREVVAVRTDGTAFPAEVALSALDAGGQPYRIAVIREVAETTDRAGRLRRHAQREAAVAELGRRALGGEELEQLMEEAARALTDAFDAEDVEVSEGEGGEAPDGTVVVPMAVRDRVRGELRVRSRDGRPFSQDDAHFVQAVADVIASATERKRAEAALGETSSRLESVIDASPAVIYLKDLEGRLILANREFEKLFRLEHGTAVGRINGELLDAEAAAEVRANDLTVLAAGRPMEIEERIQLEEGERIYISLKFPLRDAEGEIYGVGGVSTDVTERTRAREERTALEARLARAERLESVGQLAGGIAHDFNNLLAVIANYAGFLKQAVEPGTQAADDVDQILVACRGANELTRRLLLFSRRRAGNPQVIDLQTVIAETERLLRRTLGEQVELRTAVEPGLWRVRADRSQLEQVLVNLAINARDAMPEGGLLRVEAANVELAPETVPGIAGEVVRLEVSDTGAGMPDEVLDRAFEPFFSTKPAGEGTGLGLATVYGIVRGAGGHVELRSDSGTGTTVVMHLPATREPVTEAADVEASAPQPSRGERVLLVEDKEAVRVLTARILEDAGYAVHAAPDGLAALEQHGGDTDGVDVLITDIVMPGLSGQELADELRQRRPGLPVVFVSGYTEDYVVEGARREGATAFVEKPFTGADLLAAVRSVIDQG